MFFCLMNVKPFMSKRINSGKRLSRGHLWRSSIAVNATLRVDFHCCVKLTRVNKIEAMHERPRVHVRIERFNFYVYVRPSIYCLYFVYARKIYVRTQVKITRQWKFTTTV